MEAHVEYTVPVIAVVDLDEGTVTRVVVSDEEIKGPNEVLEAVGVGAGRDLTGTEKTRAKQIAESTIWPAWDTGW